MILTRLFGVGLLDDHHLSSPEDSSQCPSDTRLSFGARCSTWSPPAAGSPQVAADLDISNQAIYTWRRQELIDTGQLPGTTSADNAELIAARRRIAELEAEVAIHRRAAELLKESSTPKGVTRRSR